MGEFDEKYWIDEIIRTIIQFYMCWAGSLYFCGSLKNNCFLKIGQKGDCKIPTICPPFDQNNCVDVAIFSDHTLAVNTIGEVYAFGYGKSGALGTGNYDDVTVPTKIKMPEKAISVACGHTHSIVLTRDGRVYTFGAFQNGALGHGNTLRSLIPKCIESLKQYQIIQISAGREFSAAICNDGFLFLWGTKCGCGSGEEIQEKNIMIPTMIKLNDKVSYISCGASHSLLFTENGLIMSWGYGYKGVLGHGDDNTVYSPKIIETLSNEKIISCAAGWFHSLCINDDGIVRSFGYSGQGRLGHSGNVGKEQNTPKIIDFFSKNGIKGKDCTAGGYFSAVISQNDELYMFGYNFNYELGLNDKTDRSTPTKLKLSENVSVKKVFMGENYTAFITK